MTLTLKYANESNVEERFLELACLTYFLDHEDRRAEARRLLAKDASIAERDLFTICCTGSVSQLKERLATGEVDVNISGGPMNWPPLLYACYSRVEADGGSTMGIAKILLDHGADPNAYYMWGNQYRFTALTGVFGEGESGPKQQPPHPKCEPLAKMLLEAGADPNDSQALYNRMFTSGNLCLEMLLAAGLDVSAKNNWLITEDGQLRSEGSGTLAYQFRWAIEKQHHERVKLILDSIDEKGVVSFVNLPLDSDGLHCEARGDKVNDGISNSFLKLAMLKGNVAAQELLRSKGANEPQLNLAEQFESAVTSGNVELARKLLSENSDQAKELRRQLPGLLVNAASSNRQAIVHAALELGVDVNVQTNATALHQAAWSGHLEMVKFLLSVGADRTVKDKSHDATPADWGNYSGNHEIAEFLSSQGNDIQVD